jgi:hypothetical protein
MLEEPEEILAYCLNQMIAPTRKLPYSVRGAARAAQRLLA